MIVKTLLDLRSSTKEFVKFDYGGQKTLPPVLLGIPSYLCRYPGLHPRRKRHRRRGKRSGRLVRMKACLMRFPTASWFEYRVMNRRRLLDPIDAWLVPVIGPDEVSQPRAPRARRASEYCALCVRLLGKSPPQTCRPLLGLAW
ncbi:hypothetical protein QQF64_012061 [Cirrhinus molitorella]|uniref:Uncharacterized protein n=1 Tax=Cirrhinus molitorella TaxID=172907 RepID=A0ABR3LWR5_9TELE